jgi:WD40 repeat protein
LKENITFFFFFQKHEKTVFVLECHPTNERILCSAGHDGLLVIWDMVDGRAIKYFLNDVRNSSFLFFYI